VLGDGEEMHLVAGGGGGQDLVGVGDAGVDSLLQFCEVLLIVGVGEGHREAEGDLLCAFEAVVDDEADFIPELGRVWGTLKKASGTYCHTPWGPSRIMGLQ
jgi:hypothetical protein